MLQRIFFGSLVVSVISSAVFAETGVQETNREIVQTYSHFYFQSRDYASATALLRDYLKDDPKDASSWNILGLISLAQKDYNQAAESFSKAAEFSQKGSQERAVYNYNLADAHVRAGKADEAKHALRASLDNDSVSGSAEYALKNLHSGQALPALEFERESKSHWLMTLNSGYDSNVSLVSDSSASTTSGAASPSVQMLTQFVNASQAFGHDLDITAIGSFSLYTTSDASLYNTLYGSLGADLGSDRMKLGNQFEISFVNDSGLNLYNWTDSLRYTYYWKHGGGAETQVILPVRYLYYEFDSSTTEGEDNRKGANIRPEIVHKRRLGGFDLSAGVRYEQQFAVGQNYRSMGLILPVSLSRTLFWRMYSTLSAEFSKTLYPESTNGRNDTVMGLGLKFQRSFDRKWVGSLDYSFKRSLSTLDTANYAKHSIVVGVSYAIF